MKTRFKNQINNLALIFLMLITTFVLGFGCNTSKSIPDPLAGWHFCFSQDPSKLDKAIQADYQDYIQKLLPEERKYFGGIFLFEDGTGQHAVRIETNQNNERWYHVLIYDKENKRIKAVKYYDGRYQS